MGGARVLQLFRDASGSHTIDGRGRRRHRRRSLVAKLLDAVPVYHRRNDRRGWEFSLTERRAFRIALPRGQPISLHIVRARSRHFVLARPKGFEPPTLGSEVAYSWLDSPIFSTIFRASAAT